MFAVNVLLLTISTNSYAMSISINILHIFVLGSFAHPKGRPRNVLPLADVTNCELLIYINNTSYEDDNKFIL